MPARVFRYLLNNQVQGHTLRLVDKKLCGGVWTSDEWAPDETVGSGVTGGLQAESSGIMTGTEGWVKYRLVRNSDDAARGLVYLYWNNPYFGVTRGKCHLVGIDIVADCEAGSSAGSNFSDGTGENAPPPDLRLALVVIRRNGVPSNLDDPGDLYRLPLAPVFILGTSGIWERMEVELALTSSERPTVIPIAPPQGSRSRSLNTAPTPQALTGTWSDGVVTVAVEHLGHSQYHVTVRDLTRGASLELDTTTWLGSAGLAAMLEAGFSRYLSDHPESEAREITAVASSVAAALRAAGPSERHGAAEVVVASGVAEFARREPANETQQSAAVEAVSAAAMAHAARCEYALYPAAGLSLELYDELEDGRRRTHALHYQRVSTDGNLLVDTFLTFRPELG